ncbi:MAG: xylulokinase [Geminicoccaceae bacterium]
MAGSATIGLDIGTSATKGVLLGDDGSVLATASASYPLHTPKPGWSEQRPQDWWQASVEVLKKLTSARPVQIAAVGLSGQMHGSVFLDADDEVIRPALLWNDGRTHAECADIARRVGKERVVQITGNLPSTGFQAPKILWLRTYEPAAADRIARVLLPKDFIRLRLTGEAASDASDASGTLLLDIATRRYSPEMLAALEIPESWLPEVYEGPEITGWITGDAASVTGLPAGIPVVAGGGDNACAAIGAGVITAGIGACSVGTSGTIFVHADKPLVDPTGALNAFCAAVPGGWHSMGVVLSAGGCLSWYKDAVQPGDAAVLGKLGLDIFTALIDSAADVPPGAEGLLFLPYLAGERSPHLDPHARAAWIGLSLAHDRRHMVRALLEGVGFALVDCLERMRALGAAAERFSLVGGGGRSPAWRRILAAQLGSTLELPAAEEGPALGAALLAQVGGGLAADLTTAVRRAAHGEVAVETPDAELKAAYASVYARWRKAYPALKASGLFDA